MAGATDLNGALSRISTALNPEPEQSEPTNSDEQPVVETPQPEEQEQPSQASSEPETSESEEVPKYTVKVNGEEHEVTLDELRSGYQRQSDYSRKTAEIANKRKALEAKEEQMNAKLSEAEELIRFEVEDLQSAEMLELKEYDPEKYWKKHDRVQTKLQKFEARKREQQQKLDEKKQKLWKDEQEKLLQKVPEWMDTEKMQSESAEVMNTLASFGFSNEEIAQLSDHRMFLLARDALNLQKLRDQKPESKKVTKPPKTTKPAASQAKEQVDNDAYKAQREQLKKSGSWRDAQAAIKSLLK